MIIGIEAQRLFRKEKHGMDYVVLNELRQLQHIDSENEYYVFVKPGEDHCLSDSDNMHIVELNCPIYFIWEQWALPRAAKNKKVELLHCTSNTAPLWCGTPLLLTLHDVIFLEERVHSTSAYQRFGNYYRRIIVPRVAKKCHHIITVSNIEKTNIMMKLQIPQDRITVLHNGYDEIYKPRRDEHEVYKKYIDQPEYFFILGNTDGRKNIERMLIAYSLYLERSNIKRKLLITSLDERYIGEIMERNNLENIRDNIVLTGYVPIEDLPYLYINAFAFLFASLREGFGIPILESMACGTPVITSNTSSMPEVAGKEAILVNPENPEEIARMMNCLEEDDKFYCQQREYGLRQVISFSWEETTKRLLTIYKELTGRDITLYTSPKKQL
jgi:glycosyltransferase involved in cell wall biosynthesis